MVKLETLRLFRLEIYTKNLDKTIKEAIQALMMIINYSSDCEKRFKKK